MIPDDNNDWRLDDGGVSSNAIREMCKTNGELSNTMTWLGDEQRTLQETYWDRKDWQFIHTIVHSISNTTMTEMLTRKKTAKLLITQPMKHLWDYSQEDINYAFATLRHIKIEKIQKMKSGTRLCRSPSEYYIYCWMLRNVNNSIPLPVNRDL